MKDTNKAADFLISIIVIAISIVFFVQADKMPDSELGIGPGDYPKVICYVLFVLGIMLLVSTLIKAKGIPVIDLSGINKKYLLRAIAMFMLTFVYYLLLKKAGFLLLTPFFLFASFMLFGYKKKIKAAVIAVVFSTAVYFLFTKVFQVILPRGILG